MVRLIILSLTCCLFSACATGSSGGDVVSNGLMPMSHAIEKTDIDSTVLKVRHCLKDKTCYANDTNKLALQKTEKQLKASMKLSQSELQDKLQQNGVTDKLLAKTLAEKILKY